MYKKHTKEEWAKAFELYKDGFDTPSISRLTGLELSEIKRHIRLYRQTGFGRTERKTNVRSTPAWVLGCVSSVMAAMKNFLQQSPKGDPEDSETEKKYKRNEQT